jgi:hypothetical protein
MQADRKPLRSRSQKGLAALAAAFFLIQIAIDLGHSVTAFPFVHYGMFSESFPTADSILRYVVVVNGKTLEPADFRIYRWDMIQEPLSAFDKQTRTSDFAAEKQKFRATLPGIYSRISSNLDNSPALDTHFPEWYRNYLGRLLGEPVRTLRVNRAWYAYKDSRIILLNSTPWLTRE